MRYTIGDFVKDLSYFIERMRDKDPGLKKSIDYQTNALGYEASRIIRDLESGRKPRLSPKGAELLSEFINKQLDKMQVKKPGAQRRTKKEPDRRALVVRAAELLILQDLQAGEFNVGQFRARHRVPEDIMREALERLKKRGDIEVAE